jgi:hypothetical protein
MPTLAFTVWFQRVLEAQRATDAAQDAVTDDLAEQLALIQATQRRDAISSSYTAPSAVLTASDAGSNATITIAAHTRFYGDETSLAVAGGSLTGLAYSTIYAVYYDDSTRADTTPTYVSTTTINEAQNNYVAGRHLVGTVTTPAAAGPPTSGGTSPPGSGYTPVGGGYEIP